MPKSILGYDIIETVRPIRSQDMMFFLQLLDAVIFFDIFG
jgi:hypothetical protein